MILSWRYWSIAIFNILLVFILAHGIINVSLFPSEDIVSISKELYKSKEVAAASRGRILDRNGRVLAGPMTMYDVWIDPLKFQINETDLSVLSQILDVDETILSMKILQKNRRFQYLARNLPHHIIKKIKQLNNSTIHFYESEQRFYPYSEATANIIGIVNADGKGVDGVELVYNKLLKGHPGYAMVQKDRLGRTVQRQEGVKPINGQDVKLSIDGRLQLQAYQSLKKYAELSKAESASVVVIEVSTGKVRAMANYPSFNSNKRPFTNLEYLKNRSITDLFEPGSTMKPLIMAHLLQMNHWDVDEKVDASSGGVKIQDHEVKDVHVNKKPLTMLEVLQKSSNVALSKMVTRKPSFDLYAGIKNYGFCQKTLLDLPGEVQGICPEKSNSLLDLAALSFGYGLSVNTLQLAQSYLLLANGGFKQDVTLEEAASIPRGERVFDESVVKQITSMLKAVVEKQGTGKLAALKGIDVAGKTGTTQMLNGKYYDTSQHIASFVGMVPSEHPSLVVAVVVRQPSHKYRYGGLIAAPAFADIVSAALGYQ